MRRGYRAVAGLMLVALLPACSDLEQDGETTLPPGAVQPAPFTEAPLDTGALPPAVPAQDVQVTLTEWTVVTAQDAVPGGTITFTTRNDGTQPHALRVSGGTTDNASDPIHPGEEVRISMALVPGTYELTCPLEDHALQGMRTTLVVR